MRIYNERNQKSYMTCGYCHESGHKKNHCPTLKAHYEQDKRGEPIDVTLFSQLARWYGTTDNRLQRWYEKYGKPDAERYFGEKSEKTTTKPRKKPKCGFCGKKNHNRRNCKAMKQFKHLFEQANLAYRKQFYDHIIVDMGYGSGALVTIRSYDQETMEPVESVGLVSNLDPKSIGLGNLMQGYWSDYRTSLNTSVLVGSVRSSMQQHHRLFNFPIQTGCRETLLSQTFGIAKSDSSYTQGFITSIVSAAPQTMSQEWFDGQSEPINYVMKKRTAIDLWRNFGTVIEHYYPHSNKERKINAFKRSVGLPV